MDRSEVLANAILSWFAHAPFGVHNTEAIPVINQLTDEFGVENALIYKCQIGRTEYAHIEGKCTPHIPWAELAIALDILRERDLQIRLELLSQSRPR